MLFYLSNMFDHRPNEQNVLQCSECLIKCSSTFKILANTIKQGVQIKEVEFPGFSLSFPMCISLYFSPQAQGPRGLGCPGTGTSSPVLENFVIFRQNVDDSDKGTRKNIPIGNQGVAFTLLPMTFALLKRRYSALDKLYIVETFIVKTTIRT